MPTRYVTGLLQQATGIKGVRDHQAVLETELAVIYMDTIIKVMRTVIT